MDRNYKDDPEYQKMLQACLDANKIIGRKKVINYIIYLVIMLIIITIAIFIIWNVLGVKDIFDTYNQILG